MHAAPAHRPVTDPLPVGNPIITEVFTSDPTVVVVEDTAYLYTGHDEAAPDGTGYVMHDWLCFSSTDLLSWTPHGSPLSAADFAWSSGGAKGSNVVRRHGRYWWYVSVNHEPSTGGAIGVAVADSPTGPFRDALGRPLITNDLPEGTEDDHTIDPCAIVHNDEAWIFWGKKRCFVARLDSSMTALNGRIIEINLPHFQEGAFVHAHAGQFYLSYGYEDPQRVAYATSASLTGPWTFQGLVNEVAGNCRTNRVAIVNFQGEWYCFYHNGVLPGGGSYRRSVCVDRLRYDVKGRIQRVQMTTEGLIAPERSRPNAP